MTTLMDVDVNRPYQALDFEQADELVEAMVTDTGAWLDGQLRSSSASAADALGELEMSTAKRGSGDGDGGNGWDATSNPRRNAAVAKFRPDVAEIYEFPWDRPADALCEPWILSGPADEDAICRMPRSHPTWLATAAAIAATNPDDLVFPYRVRPKGPDPLPSARGATVVGVWWVDRKLSYPTKYDDGANDWAEALVCAPLKVFPPADAMPIRTVRSRDRALEAVRIFHEDRTTPRLSYDLLKQHEAEAVARACALPPEIFTEKDLPALARRLAPLRLGMRKRDRAIIEPGRARAAHNRTVEGAAMLAVRDALHEVGFAHLWTHRKLGLGSDIYARRVDADGTSWERHIEVKGLSGTDPRKQSLTISEFDACKASAATRDQVWWLAIVLSALDEPHRTVEWHSATEVASGKVGIRLPR